MSAMNAASLGSSSAWEWVRVGVRVGVRVWIRFRFRVGRHERQERRQLGNFLCVEMGMGKG